jgi:uncharacterized protein (DUF433 family)
MKRVIINNYIVADPQICHGKPTFKGTRIMVWQILEMLKESNNEKEIYDAFPNITRKHIKAALEYAASLTKEGYAIINTQP